MIMMHHARFNLALPYPNPQVIWESLYSTSSTRDKCTLYQLRTLIDRRNVVQDPKKDLHACQSFLSVVLEAVILAVFAQSCNIETLESADIDTILKKQLPTSQHWCFCCVNSKCPGKNPISWVRRHCSEFLQYPFISELILPRVDPGYKYKMTSHKRPSRPPLPLSCTY